ncbi:DNA topoisomerase IV subunit A [Pyrococcus horikoshii]|uniref:Type 2 DNA topoisomerase 6 subunit A n=2 Tax=Pyrococcus horikoshii TaxID=53953 RepID=TOP6A_PYRHO|nr:DNA topoisomerase IV subunit A [Pyrococcus horikoshii]O59209.2 RecName: Full=Type 2 DNA topoisomerase 6 subunit A; AltName: Full=Type II DNA topoisomerase VI subunit A [Pyrococcus horikoshii OT3]HII60546.1 DNA topoisomerase IV subunit A [Pyrococcus horikoshii]
MKLKRQKPKEKFSYDPQKVLKKLEDLAWKILEEAKSGKNPYFDVPTRGLNNVYFDEESRLIRLGDRLSRRYFLNVAHARKFMQTLILMAYIKRLVSEGKHASLREAYYANKHTVPGTRENTFEDQSESDPIIEDLERMLGVLREEMHITADRRGYIYGDIVIKDGEDEFNASKLGTGGWAVPGTVEHIQFPEINVDYVLVVETAAMADRLIEEKYPKRENCLIVATQGQASRGVRRLIHRLHYEEGLPIIVFTDGDPYGWYIYSTIKRGSINLAYLSEKLATPDAKFVGMTMDDIKEYNLENVTEKLKGIPPDKKGGPTGDYKRLIEELNYPWFQDKEWQRQLKLALKWGVRIEQQALANKSLEFVAKEYLPEKIREGKLLP